MDFEQNDETLIDVKVISSKGQVTLVGWDDAGRFRRILIPREAIFSDKGGKGQVTQESLDMGIPYGVNWEIRIKKSFIITGAKVAEQLEVAGIWTKEDYAQNPSTVQHAVLGAAREILVELNAIIRNIPK